MPHPHPHPPPAGSSRPTGSPVTAGASGPSWVTRAGGAVRVAGETGSPTRRPCLWLFSFRPSAQGKGDRSRRALAPPHCAQSGRPEAEVTASALVGYRRVPPTRRRPHCPPSSPRRASEPVAGVPARGVGGQGRAQKPARPREEVLAAPLPTYAGTSRRRSSRGAGGPPRPAPPRSRGRGHAVPRAAPRAGSAGRAQWGRTSRADSWPWGARTPSSRAGLCAGRRGSETRPLREGGAWRPRCRLPGMLFAPRAALGGEGGGGRAESFLRVSWAGPGFAFSFFVCVCFLCVFFYVTYLDITTTGCPPEMCTHVE